VGKELDRYYSGNTADADDELVWRLRAGDREVWSEIARRHGERLYQATFAILRDREAARDAVQDTFVRLIQYGHRFEGRAKFSTWLVAVAKNAALQRLRRRRIHESLDSVENRPDRSRAGAGGADPEAVFARAELHGAVTAGVGRLPNRLRQAVRLLDLDQLPVVEAAKQLSVSVPALKARHLRGRRMLVNALGPVLRMSGKSKRAMAAKGRTGHGVGKTAGWDRAGGAS
jgi:RNA polymerase sigma-70 factor (ECF subfamily)